MEVYGGTTESSNLVYGVLNITQLTENGIMGIKEDRLIWFSKGWQGSSKRFPEGKAQEILRSSPSSPRKTLKPSRKEKEEEYFNWPGDSLKLLYIQKLSRPQCHLRAAL